MDLVEILNKIIRTKTQIKNIIGETDNIARYYVTIHNTLAEKYNLGYKNGFHDKWYDLTGVERFLAGPKEMLDYDYYLNDVYYEVYTPSILADIMSNVLANRLNIRDELNEYLDPDIGDEFKDYPDYLNYLLNQTEILGYDAGVLDATDAYEKTGDIQVPDFQYLDNRFTISSEQEDVSLFYKLEENGIDTYYSGPVVLSENTRVYYWARAGKSMSQQNVYYDCVISSEGALGFVSSPNIIQEDGRIYLTCNTNGAMIYYSIDSGKWKLYSGPIFVSSDMGTIKTMASYKNEYSKYNSQAIDHQVVASDKPAAPKCSFTKGNGYATVTLTCATAGAAIRYSIDEHDGFFREYSGSFIVNMDHFLLYTYSEAGNIKSDKLVYKYDVPSDATKPADVQFANNTYSIDLYTVTPNANIYYRFGSAGEFTPVHGNSVTLTPQARTTIYAMAELNGVYSPNITQYTFTPANITTKPPKPNMIQDGNKITIVSDYTVKYTTDLSSPEIYGRVYNPNQGITITQFTTIYSAAINNGVYSDWARGNFSYDDTAEGGSSGSTPVNPNNGQETNENFEPDNWFTVKGASEISFSGYNGQSTKQLYFAQEGSDKWSLATGSTITGLDPTKKTYMKGSIKQITGFANTTAANVNNGVTISGDPASIINGRCGDYDIEMAGLFKNCAGLTTANLNIGINNMPDGMLKEMFSGCQDLVSANFNITSSICSKNGMEKMFYNCTKLQAGPIFNFNEVKDNGMKSCFEGCSKLTGTGSISCSVENTIGAGAFESCFKNCAQLYTYNISTPQGTAATNAFKSMFEGCVSLNDISYIRLNYNKMGISTCERMFYGCTSLTRAIELEAKELGQRCYYEMFMGCTSLNTKPVMKGITLADSCCYRMFSGCINLTDAPDLNTTRISYSMAYNEMFDGCSNLMHIKAMFTDWGASGAKTGNWVRGVNTQNGVFEYNNEAEWVFYSNARGNNGVPQYWDLQGADPVIDDVEMFFQNGILYIRASAGTIYWKFGQVLDTQEFTESNKWTYGLEGVQMTQPGYVSAAVKNDDGKWGRITTKYFSEEDIGFPDLVISLRDGKLLIGTGTDFEYSLITYKICDYGTNTLKQGESQKTYDKNNRPAITERCRIWAYGTTGSYTKENFKDLIPAIPAPTIQFYYVWNGDHTQILNYQFAVNYPDTNILQQLYYKINDRTDDNPDTNISVWNSISLGQQVSVNSYMDAYHPKVTVTAIAKVKYENIVQWSPMWSAQMDMNNSETIYAPVLKQISGTNTIYVEYAGEEYRDRWPATMDVKVWYGFGSEAQVFNYQYDTPFNLSKAGYTASRNIDVWTCAKIGNVESDKVKYTFYFDTSLIHFDINDPVVTIKTVGDKIYICVTNDSEYVDWAAIQAPKNYITISVIETKGLNPQGGIYNGEYVPIFNDYELDNQVVKFVVWAYSVYDVTNDQTEPKSWGPYDIRDYINWGSWPAPRLSQNTNTQLVTVDCTPYSVTPYMKIETASTSWGTGATDTNKYNNAGWRACTYFGIGNVNSNGIWTGYLDSALHDAKIYSYYNYDSADSEQGFLNYLNENVSQMVAPSIAVDYDSTRNCWILKLTNTSNPGVWLKFKMTDTEWGGLQVETDIYDDWQIIDPTYGVQIDPDLKYGKIWGRTYLSDSEYVDTDSYVEFINSKYKNLDKPRISVNGNIMNISNTKTERVSNYWRCTYANSEWAPNDVQPHIYDTWQLSPTTGNNTLNTSLLRGKIEAYSWISENENTYDNLVQYQYESGQTIDNDPPTIEPTKYSDHYDIKITNNADRNIYYHIKWMLDDIEWNLESNTFLSADRFQKSIGDRFLVATNKSSHTFQIYDEVKSATIKAFATDNSSSTDTFNTANNTPMTIYSFVNQNLTS